MVKEIFMVIRTLGMNAECEWYRQIPCVFANQIGIWKNNKTVNGAHTGFQISCTKLLNPVSWLFSENFSLEWLMIFCFLIFQMTWILLYMNKVLGCEECRCKVLQQVLSVKSFEVNVSYL